MGKKRGYIEATEAKDPKPSDVQVWRMIGEMIGANNRMEFMILEDTRKKDVIVELRKKGASVRQLERLTGVGRGIIQRLK